MLYQICTTVLVLGLTAVVFSWMLDDKSYNRGQTWVPLMGGFGVLSTTISVLVMILGAIWGV